MYVFCDKNDQQLEQIEAVGLRYNNKFVYEVRDNEGYLHFVPCKKTVMVYRLNGAGDYSFVRKIQDYHATYNFVEPISG